jgi:hypothetical protein
LQQGQIQLQTETIFANFDRGYLQEIMQRGQVLCIEERNPFIVFFSSLAFTLIEKST